MRGIAVPHHEVVLYKVRAIWSPALNANEFEVFDRFVVVCLSPRVDKPKLQQMRKTDSRRTSRGFLCCFCLCRPWLTGQVEDSPASNDVGIGDFRATRLKHRH